MASRKPFLLRVEPAVLTAIERWAADELRSVNGQIEYLLRDALRRAGRKVVPVPEVVPDAPDGAEAADDDDTPAAPPPAEAATGAARP
ncbi:MAG TPA: hypothetical protein VHE35_31720, partial [Kofleriaceae bacterium]|nr:hypothetical protein [Kofleriaceae bacterium]